MSSERRQGAGLLGWLAGTDATSRLDEREQSLLHEAYTVGFTVFAYLCFILAAAEVWFGGPGARWPSLWTMLLPAIPAFVVMRRNAAQGGPPLYSNRCLPLRDRLVRSAPLVALALVWLAGFLRWSREPFDLSTAAGMAVGFLVGLGAVVAVAALIHWTASRRRAAETAGWDDDTFD